MFLDEKRLGPRPEPLPEKPPRPRQEKVLLWVIGFNILMLLVAPIGGATILEWAFVVGKP